MSRISAYLPTYRPRDCAFRNAYLAKIVNYLGSLSEKYLNAPNPTLNEIGPKSVANAKAAIQTEVPVIKNKTTIQKMWISQREDLKDFPGTVFEIAGSKAATSFDEEELIDYFKKVGLSAFINDFVLARWRKPSNDIDPRTAIPNDVKKDACSTNYKIKKGSLAILRHLMKTEGNNCKQGDFTVIDSNNDYQLIKLNGCDVGTGVYIAFCLFSESNLHLVFFRDEIDSLDTATIYIESDQLENFLQALVSKGLGVTRPVDSANRDYRAFFNLLFKLSQGEPCHHEEDYITYLNTFLKKCHDKNWDAERIAKLIKNLVGNHSQDSEKAMASILLNFEWTLHLGNPEWASRFTPEFINDIWKHAFDIDDKKPIFTLREELKKKNPFLFLKQDGVSSELIGAILFSASALTNSLPAAFKTADGKTFDSALTRHLNKPMLEVITPFNTTPVHLKDIQSGHSHFLSFDPLRWIKAIDTHFASLPKLFLSDTADILQKLFNDTCEAFLLQGDFTSPIEEQRRHLLYQEKELLPFIEKFLNSENLLLIKVATSLATMLTAMGSEDANTLLFAKCLPALKKKDPRLARILFEKMLQRYTNGTHTLTQAHLELIATELKTYKTAPEIQNWNRWLLLLLEKLPNEIPNYIHLINPFHLSQDLLARWLQMVDEQESALPILKKFLRVRSTQPENVIARLENETEPDAIIADLNHLYAHDLDEASLEKVASAIIRVLPTLIDRTASQKHIHRLLDFPLWERYADPEKLAACLEAYFNKVPYDKDLHATQLHWLGIALSLQVNVPKTFLKELFTYELVKKVSSPENILTFLSRIKQNPQWMNINANSLDKLSHSWAERAYKEGCFSTVDIAQFPFDKTLAESPEGYEFFLRLLEDLIQVGTDEALAATIPLFECLENATIAPATREQLNQLLLKAKKSTKAAKLTNACASIKAFYLHSEITLLAGHLKIDIADLEPAKYLPAFFRKINGLKEIHIERLRFVTWKALKSLQLTPAAAQDILVETNALPMLGEDLWFEMLHFWLVHFADTPTNNGQGRKIIDSFLEVLTTSPKSTLIAWMLLERNLLKPLYELDRIVCAKLAKLAPAIDNASQSLFYIQALNAVSKLPPEEFYTILQIYELPGIHNKVTKRDLNRISAAFKKLIPNDIRRALTLLNQYPHLQKKENWLAIWKQYPKMEVEEIKATFAKWQLDPDPEAGAIALQAICNVDTTCLDYFVENISFAVLCLNQINPVENQNKIVLSLLRTLIAHHKDKEFIELLQKFPQKCSFDSLSVLLHALNLSDIVKNDLLEFIEILPKSKQANRADCTVLILNTLEKKHSWQSPEKNPLLQRLFKACWAISNGNSLVRQKLLEWMLQIPDSHRDNPFVLSLLENISSLNPTLSTLTVAFFESRINAVEPEELDRYIKILSASTFEEHAKNHLLAISKLFGLIFEKLITNNTTNIQRVESVVSLYLKLNIQGYHLSAIQLLCKLTDSEEAIKVFKSFILSLISLEPQMGFEVFKVLVGYKGKHHGFAAAYQLQSILEQTDFSIFPRNVLVETFTIYFTNTQRNRKAAIKHLQMIRDKKNFVDMPKELAAWEILNVAANYCFTTTEKAFKESVLYLTDIVLDHAPDTISQALIVTDTLFTFVVEDCTWENYTSLFEHIIIDKVCEHCKNKDDKYIVDMAYKVSELFIQENCRGIGTPLAWGEFFLLFLIAIHNILNNKDTMHEIYQGITSKLPEYGPQCIMFCEQAKLLEKYIRAYEFRFQNEEQVIRERYLEIELEFKKLRGTKDGDIEQSLLYKGILWRIAFILLHYNNSPATTTNDYKKIKEITIDLCEYLRKINNTNYLGMLYYYIARYSFMLLKDESEKQHFWVFLLDALERKDEISYSLLKLFCYTNSFKAIVPTSNTLRIVTHALHDIIGQEFPHHEPPPITTVNSLTLNLRLWDYVELSKNRFHFSFWIRGLFHFMPQDHAANLIRRCIDLGDLLKKPNICIFYIIELYENMNRDISHLNADFETYLSYAIAAINDKEAIHTLKASIISSFINILIQIAPSVEDAKKLVPFLAFNYPIGLQNVPSKIDYTSIHPAVLQTISDAKPEDLPTLSSQLKTIISQISMTESQINEIETELLIRIHRTKLMPSIRICIGSIVDSTSNVFCSKLVDFCKTLIVNEDVTTLFQLPSDVYQKLLDEKNLNILFAKLLMKLDTVEDDNFELLLAVLQNSLLELNAAQQKKIIAICNKYAVLYDKVRLIIACMDSELDDIQLWALNTFKESVLTKQKINREGIRKLVLTIPKYLFSYEEQLRLVFQVIRCNDFSQDFIQESLLNALDLALNFSEFQKAIELMEETQVLGKIDKTKIYDFCLAVAGKLANCFLLYDCKSNLEDKIIEIITILIKFTPKCKFINQEQIISEYNFVSLNMPFSKLAECIKHYFQFGFFVKVIHQLHEHYVSNDKAEIINHWTIKLITPLMTQNNLWNINLLISSLSLFHVNSLMRYEDYIIKLQKMITQTGCLKKIYLQPGSELYFKLLATLGSNIPHDANRPQLIIILDDLLLVEELNWHDIRRSATILMQGVLYKVISLENAKIYYKTLLSIAKDNSFDDFPRDGSTTALLGALSQIENVSHDLTEDTLRFLIRVLKNYHLNDENLRIDELVSFLSSCAFVILNFKDIDPRQREQLVDAAKPWFKAFENVDMQLMEQLDETFKAKFIDCRKFAIEFYGDSE